MLIYFEFSVILHIFAEIKDTKKTNCYETENHYFYKFGEGSYTRYF